MDQFGLGARIGTDATNPVLCVYFSVARPSKLGWYADITSTVSSGSKNSDGTMSYQVNVAFANVMNSAEVEPAGEYIAGTWEGDMDAYIQIIAPAGSMISDFKSTLPPSDRNPSWNQTVYDGLQMAYLKSATLKPGQVIECAFTVTTAKDAQPLQVKNTPTLTSYR